MGGWLEFAQGYGLGQRMVEGYNTVQKKKDLKDVMEQQETPSFTADQDAERTAKANAKDENGNPIYNFSADEQGNISTTLNKVAVPNAAPEAYEPVSVAQKGVSFLGKSYDAPLTEGQRSSAQNSALSGVLAKHGDIEGSMRIRRDAKQESQSDQRFAWDKTRTEQEIADKQAIRNVMNQGVPPVQANAQPDAQGAQGDQAGKQPDDLHAYVQNTAPVVIKTLLSQGKIEEAKRYSDFVDSNEGKTYAKSWVTGLRKHAMGDHAGAIKAFEKLYNDQLYSDGQTVKIDPLDGGKQYQVEMFGTDGKSLGRQTLDPATLANQAAMMLEPTRAVEFVAQQTGKREAEAATLERQMRLEQIRQGTAEMREDRRDQRFARGLQFKAENPSSRGGGITPVQQRSNLEIDAARQQVANLTPAEIRRRTSPKTDIGLKNPDYDPSLTRTMTLAGRRKVGDDDTFDQKLNGSTPKPASQNQDRQDVAQRFGSDKSMSQYRLGNATPKGTEVLDKSGKVIGHYR